MLTSSSGLPNNRLPSSVYVPPEWQISYSQISLFGILMTFLVSRLIKYNMFFVSFTIIPDLFEFFVFLDLIILTNLPRYSLKCIKFPVCIFYFLTPVLSFIRVRILAMSLLFHLITPASFFKVPLIDSERSLAKSTFKSLNLSLRSSSLNCLNVLVLFLDNYLFISPLFSNISFCCFSSFGSCILLSFESDKFLSSGWFF